MEEKQSEKRRSMPRLVRAPRQGRLGQADVGVFFFFQAEDGIRDYKVTGVQTCALPILVEQGLYRAGARALTLGLARNPYRRDALFSLAVAHYQLRDSAALLPVAQRLLVLDPLNRASLKLVAAGWDFGGRRDSTRAYVARADTGLAVEISVPSWGSPRERSSWPSTAGRWRISSTGSSSPRMTASCSRRGWRRGRRWSSTSSVPRGSPWALRSSRHASGVAAITVISASWTVIPRACGRRSTSGMTTIAVHSGTATSPPFR